MSTQKIVLLLGLIGAAGVGYHVINQKPPPRPVNPRVNEHNFDQLRSGMSSEQVEGILGPADVTAAGTLFQVQQLDSQKLQCTIEPATQGDRGDIMKTYEGAKEESIRALFSAKGEKLTAAEYRVSGYAVLYRGPRTSSHSRSYIAVSTDRSEVPEETRKRQENLSRYQRRRTLENRKGGSFFGGTSETQPDSSATVEAPSASRPEPVQAVPTPQTAVAEPVGRQRRAYRAAPPIADIAEATEPTSPLRIELPSKKVLSDTVPSFNPPAQWQQNFFPPGAEVYVARRGGNVQGVFVLSKSKLQGASVTLHGNGRLQTIAFFSEGKLHGPVRSWTDQKQRLLYAEYKNGNKHGLVCLYDEEKPRLAQEWNNAKLEREYLVTYNSQTPTILASADIQGKSAELDQAQAQLNDLEERMRIEQSRIRSEIVEQTRKEDRRVKQRRVAESASGRRLGGSAADGVQPIELESRWRSALAKATD